MRSVQGARLFTNVAHFRLEFFLEELQFFSAFECVRLRSPTSLQGDARCTYSSGQNPLVNYIRNHQNAAALVQPGWEGPGATAYPEISACTIEGLAAVRPDPKESLVLCKPQPSKPSGSDSTRLISPETRVACSLLRGIGDQDSLGASLTERRTAISSEKFPDLVQCYLYGLCVRSGSTAVGWGRDIGKKCLKLDAT